MKKRIAVVLMILMVFTLVGCGQTASTSGGEIKIGSNFEMSGASATFGQSSVNGIKLAFKEINAKGGVLGKQLKLIEADNKSEPGESTVAATKLITQDKVVAVLGSVASSDTLAAAPVAMENKIPLLSPTSTNPKVTVDKDTGKVKDYVFRVCFIDPFQGEVAANFVQNELKAKSAAVFIDQKSDYSQGLAEVFIDIFKRNGGTITTQEKYVAAQDKDFKATLTKIKSTNPDVIFIPGYYQEVGLIAKQARDMGLNVPLVGGDGWDSSDLVKIAGKEALNNTYFVNHVATDDPAVKEFVENYKKEYNQDPDALAVLAYDAAYVIADAIKTAGDTNGDKIKTALENLKDFNALSGKTSIDPKTHNPIKSAVILEIKDGKNIFKAKIEPKK
jgi:branched-chain amino acid transport system substrate-binding protein